MTHNTCFDNQKGYAREYNLTVYDTKEPEKVLRELLSWLGLDWEPKLLNHQVEDLVQRSAIIRASTMFHV